MPCAANPGPKRVFYVEDMAKLAGRGDPRAATTITLVLAMLAGVALDLAREHRPDLILLDLHLPGMPSEQLLALLWAEAQRP